MTDFTIIEGRNPDTGAAVFLVVKTDTLASPGATLRFDNAQDAKEHIDYLRGVRAMHRQMYGNDLL